MQAKPIAQDGRKTKIGLMFGLGLMICGLLCVGSAYAGYLEQISINDCIQRSTRECVHSVCINPSPASCEEQCRKNATARCKALSKQIDVIGRDVNINSLTLPANRN